MAKPCKAKLYGENNVIMLSANVQKQLYVNKITTRNDEHFDEYHTLASCRSDKDTLNQTLKLIAFPFLW